MRDLTQERLMELFQYNPVTGELVWREGVGHRLGGKRAGTIMRDGYRRVIADGARYYAHRLIFFMQEGRWPDGQMDHRNGQRSDNRWSNLREATQSQNQANKGPMPFSKTGIKGVSMDRSTGRWRASIRADRKDRYLGSFDTIREAAEAYKAAAAVIYGEFARAEPFGFPTPTAAEE